jgi:myo-inositol catabolism protein IolC
MMYIPWYTGIMNINEILTTLGYDHKLCILPFDHRSYFEQLLGFTEPLTDDQSKSLSEYKKIVYLGYEKSLELGIPKETSAILVDDMFGLEILLDAKSKGYNLLQSTEVSGDNHFEFQHGADWKMWIEKVKPTFVKALVRYNPDDHKDLNSLSLDGLRELSNYAHTHGYKFLIEPLVPASEAQLKTLKDDKHRYDTELRPSLTARMITEMQNAGVEPDIWKIEGMFDTEDYATVVTAARQGGRNHVGVISLGRNETDEVVEVWLKMGAMTPGVIGFAVGRTIFLNALMKFRSKEFTQDQAVQEIAERFVHFYNVFNGK